MQVSEGGRVREGAAPEVDPLLMPSFPSIRGAAGEGYLYGPKGPNGRGLPLWAQRTQWRISACVSSHPNPPLTLPPHSACSWAQGFPSLVPDPYLDTPSLLPGGAPACS